MCVAERPVESLGLRILCAFTRTPITTTPRTLPSVTFSSSVSHSYRRKMPADLFTSQTIDEAFCCIVKSLLLFAELCVSSLETFSKPTGTANLSNLLSFLLNTLVLGNLLGNRLLHRYLVKTFCAFPSGRADESCASDSDSCYIPTPSRRKQRAHEKHFSFLTWLSSRADIASRLA